MANETRRLFEELIKRKQNIKEAESFILREELKFNEIVKDARECVSSNKKQIMNIYESNIILGADTLIEEIAKEWGTSVNDLEVSLSFVDTAQRGKMGKNKFIRISEFASFDGIIKCSLNVKACSDDMYKVINLNLPLNLLHFQRNGKRLKNCLDVKTEFRDWALYTDFECSDILNLMFEFRYDALVDTSKEEFTPRDKKCELILNAYERECEKENDIPSHDRHKYIQS